MLFLHACMNPCSRVLFLHCLQVTLRYHGFTESVVNDFFSMIGRAVAVAAAAAPRCSNIVSLSCLYVAAATTVMA